MPIPSVQFSALLLLGGKSSRMGTPKHALLREGRPLWEHQLATLRSLRPAKLFLSGPAIEPFTSSNLPILEDETPGLGPLSGIVNGLQTSTSPFLLLLAVDLPNMTAEFLLPLLEKSQSSGLGQIPLQSNWWQPLAAVVPKTLLPLAKQCLTQSDRSLQNLVRLGIQQGLLQSFPVSAESSPLFKNLNSPEDL